MCSYITKIGNSSDTSSDQLSDLSATILAVYSPTQITTVNSADHCKNASSYLLEMTKKGYLKSNSGQNVASSNLINLASNFVLTASIKNSKFTNPNTSNKNITEINDNFDGFYVDGFIAELTTEISKTLIEGQVPVSFVSENADSNTFSL
jgi:hypothetical protein